MKTERKAWSGAICQVLGQETDKAREEWGMGVETDTNPGNPHPPKWQYLQYENSLGRGIL